MHIRIKILLGMAVLCVAGVSTFLYASQESQNSVVEILARSRLFRDIGPGIVDIKRDAAGHYYILAAPANVIQIYDSDGKRIGQIPNSKAGAGKIAYAEAIDLGSDGRVFVADRGANAVKIFTADGVLQSSIPVTAPVSLAVLPGGECAVVSLRSDHLVNVFDSHASLVRSFGDVPDAAEAADPNRQLTNRGRLARDPAGDIYFSFTYLPQATFRKYDRYGYAAFEVSVPTPDLRASESDRREFITIEKRDGALAAKPVLSALGVDAANQQIWAAIQDELVHFDKDGNRLESYRIATNEGARLDADVILVEPNRLVIAADPLGIFDFARPDKQPQGAPNP